jgi:glutathione S-transferase
MLTIWGRLNSHNVKKVAWLAQEIGLPHQRIDMGGPFGFTDDYLAKNPNRLIPTIEDGDLVLWESNAILRYLAAQYAPELWPADLALRAQADRWMDWQFQFADAQRDAFVGLVRTAPEGRDETRIARAAETSANMMRILDAQLARQPWLTGAHFGVADIPMGVYAHTYFTLAIPRPELPHLADWYARLRARPGYTSLVMIPLT